MAQNSALNSTNSMNSQKNASNSSQNSQASLNSKQNSQENSSQNSKNAQNSATSQKNSTLNLKNYFSFHKLKSKLKEHFARYDSFYLFLVLAYAFSVLCRLYWVWWASDFDSFKFNDSLMIISNDGYVFAEGARDKIAGFHQPNDLSFIDSPLAILTYFVYKLTPFSFESIILYMSVFLSSLIVVPVLLIARIYGNLKAGFVAALLASVANSYYNRTMAGYFDTDMLVISLPMLLIYCMLRFIIKKDALSLIAMPLIMIFYLWYYPSSYTLNCALIALFVLYALVFHRKETIFYFAGVLMMITLSNEAWYYESALITLLFALWGFKNEWFKLKFIIVIFVFAFVFVALSGGFNAIWYQLSFYIFKSDVLNVAQSFAYFNVSQTIQEASNIGLSMFMQRISASELAFLLSCFGLVLLLKQHKSFILALPMLALGFLALRGGLRFTIYAVPVMALGFGFGLFWLISQIQKFKSKLGQIRFSELFYSTRIYQILFVTYIILFVYFCMINLEFVNKDSIMLILRQFGFLTQLLFLSVFGLIFFEMLRAKYLNLARYFAILVALFFSLGYAFLHIYTYKASSVFNHNEVLILNSLKGIADREDYVVAWWDYGYPVRYYSDVKTLVDGGKHLGKDNFFASFVLSQNERAGANLARLAVEYTEKSFYERNDTLLQSDLLKAMMRDYAAGETSNDALIFLNSLKNPNFTLKTPKTRDIFVYMPLRMAMIFSTVASFSKIDLATGEINSPFVFSTAMNLGALEDGSYALSNGMVLANDFTALYVSNRALKIHSITDFNSIKNKDFKQTLVDENGDFFVFYFKENFGLPVQFIIMDKTMFESAFVQMFFFENYDKSLYELVLSEKEAKVYKLKK